MICIQGLHDRVFPADAALVPGNEIFVDGRLSPGMRARVRAAYGLYSRRLVGVVIVSGGTGASGANEALAMRDYLLELGLPAKDLIVDPEGADAGAAASFTGRYLERNNLESVIAVSQFFHLPRLVMLLKNEGVPRVGSLHADHFEARDVFSVLREIPACFAHWSRIK
jgi:vancomycin permeability regulator SanA